MGSWYDAPDPDSGLYPNDFDPSLDPSLDSGSTSNPIFGDIGGHGGGGGGTDPITGTQSGGHEPSIDIGDGHGGGHGGGGGTGHSNHFGTDFGNGHTAYGGGAIPEPAFGNAQNDILSLARQAWDPIYSFTGGGGGGFYGLQGKDHGMDSWGNYQLQVGPDPRQHAVAQGTNADGTPNTEVPKDLAGNPQTFTPFDPWDPLQVTINESYLREGLRPWYEPSYLPRNPIRPAGSLF